MNRVKLVVMLYGVAAAVCLLLHANPTAAEKQAQPEENITAEIRQLQQERVAALTKVVEISLEMYAGGVREFSSVAEAQQDLLIAMLDATEKPKERIPLLQRQLKVAETAMNYAHGKFANGTATEADSLRSKAVVLDIKIKLLKEQAKAAANCGCGPVIQRSRP